MSATPTLSDLAVQRLQNQVQQKASSQRLLEMQSWFATGLSIINAELERRKQEGEK